jgi:hypothetical protein
VGWNWRLEGIINKSNNGSALLGFIKGPKTFLKFIAMGLFNRLFESQVAKVERLEREKVEERKAIIKKIIDAFSEVKNMRGSRFDNSGSVSEALSKSVSKVNKVHFPKLWQYVESHPDDHPIAFLVYFIGSIGHEAWHFFAGSLLSGQERDFERDSKLTFATLAMMQNQPSCINEAIDLVGPDLDVQRTDLRLDSTDISSAMDLYDKLWKTFANTPNLVCPLDLDVGKKTGITFRHYINKANQQ